MSNSANRLWGRNGPWSAKPVLWLSLGLVVLSALWLAALQYRSLDTIIRNQEEHRRSAFEGALRRTAKDLDFEISRVFMAFHLASAGEQQAAAVLDEWRRSAPYPKTVRVVYWVDGVNQRLSRGPIGLSPAQDTSAMDDLTRIDQLLQARAVPAAPMEIFEHPLGFLITALPAIPPPVPSMVPSIRSAAGLRPLPGGLFVALDQDYLAHDLLPVLLRGELGYSESDYELAVFRNSDGSRVSGKAIATSGAVSSSVALLRVGLGCAVPPSPGKMSGLNLLGSLNASDIMVPLRALLAAKAADCSTPEIAPESRRGAWMLTATPRTALSLKVFERRSLFVTSAAALSLACSLVMLLVLITRAQHLARLQMEFVASVSHELRTPLGTIGVAADNLCSGLVHNRDEAVEYGRVIQEESRRLSHLVEQVLTYAGALAARWEPSRSPLAVNQVIELALCNSGQALRTAGLGVELSIAPDLPPITGDLQALARSLQNLLDNCAKYAPQGGVVVLQADTITVAKGPEVRLSVEDHGPGLTAGERKNIFEPFVRGSQAAGNRVSGFGLGLNIAKRIVEAHHGTIETFEPAGAHGAGFLIRLPAGARPVQQGAA